MPEAILAIDVGTTSVRAAVVSPSGVFSGLTAAPLTSLTLAPGRVEQDAGKVWAATRRVIAGALKAANTSPCDIAAIGLTTQRASAMAWDRRTGRPLSPMVVWSDLRGAAQAGNLAQAGFMVAPQQSATKLPAILTAIDAPARTVAWGNIDSYILFRLSGGATHASDRSQMWPSGYLGFPHLGLNDRLIAHQGLDPSAFPALVDTWGPIGVTDPAVFGAAVPITADIADQQSALTAHGDAAGTSKFTFGTSATYDLATGTAFMFPSPSAPPLLVSSVAGDTRFCVEGMVLAAGSAVDWLRAACGLGGHDRFGALAASVSSTAGAAFLPALQGLGAPHGDPNRRGALTGLTGAVTRAHLARAGLEGVAHRAREVVDHIEAVTNFPRAEALGMDGGLTRSDVFLQILADTLGRPVRRHATPEATLLGAAMAAGKGAGLLNENDAAAMIRFDEPAFPALSADEAAARHQAWKAAVYATPTPH